MVNWLPWLKEALVWTGLSLAVATSALAEDTANRTWKLARWGLAWEIQVAELQAHREAGKQTDAVQEGDGTIQVAAAAWPVSSPAVFQNTENSLLRLVQSGENHVLSEDETRMINRMLSLVPDSIAGDLLQRFDALNPWEQALVWYWYEWVGWFNEFIRPEDIELHKEMIWDFRVPPGLTESILNEMEKGEKADEWDIEAFKEVLLELRETWSIGVQTLEDMVDLSPTKAILLPVWIELDWSRKLKDSTDAVVGAVES